MRRHTFLVYSNNFKYFNALQKFFNNYTSLFTHSYSVKKTLLSWIKFIFYVWTLAKNSMLCCFVQTFSLKYWRKNLQTHIEYSCHHSIFNLSAKYNKNWHQRNAFWLWFILNSSYLFRKFKRKTLCVCDSYAQVDFTLKTVLFVSLSHFFIELTTTP